VPVKLILKLSEIGRIHPLLSGSCLDVPPNIVTIGVIKAYEQKMCQQEKTEKDERFLYH
jgi:hypothetical protein